MSNFIHFGCWNQGICNINSVDNPLSRVMTKLLEYTMEYETDFISVAGDNYYPNKLKKIKDKTLKKSDTEKIKKDKKKIIKLDEMLSGFNCLPEGIDIYMLLGNHDLETNKKSKPTLFINNTDNIESNCFILNAELDFSENHNPPINFIFNKSKLLDNTLVLMLDTSMYDKKADKYLQCYNKLLGTEFKSILDIHKLQLDFVQYSILENIDKFENLVLIGHHPITGTKEKNEEIFLIEPFEKFLELLNIIFDILKYSVNYYYLCADLHLHQEGEVIISQKKEEEDEIMIIDQYIIGTGGTKLDPNPSRLLEDNLIETENNDIYYNMLLSKEEYGFLDCNIIDGELFFEFINAN